MSSTYWDRVVTGGLAVPADRPLAELTEELTVMLGSTDPALRDEVAFQVLATWIERGVYDDLLAGLGDGMAAGLRSGLGERGTDTVFRRSFSALVLGQCLARNNTTGLLPASQVLRWGDQLAHWYVHEQDLRGWVEDKGWAHAAAHGADAIGVLGQYPELGRAELVVLLDVIADRVLAPTADLLVAGEPDRIALATLHVLRRDLVPLSVLEPWVSRIAAGAGEGEQPNPFPALHTAQAFLRALHLQLALAMPRPPVRADLLLVLVDALRASNPHYLPAP